MFHPASGKIISQSPQHSPLLNAACVAGKGKWGGCGEWVVTPREALCTPWEVDVNSGL